LIEKAIQARARAARGSLAEFDKAERKLANLRIKRVQLDEEKRNDHILQELR
jgi:hypothetical protein